MTSTPPTMCPGAASKGLSVLVLRRLLLLPPVPWRRSLRRVAEPRPVLRGLMHDIAFVASGARMLMALRGRLVEVERPLLAVVSVSRNSVDDSQVNLTAFGLVTGVNDAVRTWNRGVADPTRSERANTLHDGGHAPAPAPAVRAEPFSRIVRQFICIRLHLPEELPPDQRRNCVARWHGSHTFDPTRRIPEPGRRPADSERLPWPFWPVSLLAPVAPTAHAAPFTVKSAGKFPAKAGDTVTVGQLFGISTANAVVESTCPAA